MHGDEILVFTLNLSAQDSKQLEKLRKRMGLRNKSETLRAAIAIANKAVIGGSRG